MSTHLDCITLLDQ